MLLTFIDETADHKFKQYLGFCVATINAKFYPLLKREAQEILASISWDSSVEFKGSFLFSKSNGCTDVEVETRIDAAHQLLDLNISKKNSRLRFYYGGMYSENHTRDYVESLPPLIEKALPRAAKGAGKNLISVMCDERSDVSAADLHSAIQPAVEANGYTVHENVMSVRSTFDSIGLMYADLVGYLAGRVETIGNDSELFEGLTEEQLHTNGKIRKLRSSSELIEKVKCLDIYSHIQSPAS
ncbi:MAG: hypothetical protein AAGA44_07550 [Pseudomonadota bacterium]